jgi:hypothetical protein
MVTKSVKRMLFLGTILMLGLFSQISFALADSIYITIGNYHAISYTMAAGDNLDITGSVSDSNTVDIYIFDQEHYHEFSTQAYTYGREELYLDQSTISITFEAPYADTWYVVFWNDNAPIVHVTFTATHQTISFSFYFLLFSGIALCGMVMVMRKKLKSHFNLLRNKSINISVKQK